MGRRGRRITDSRTLIALDRVHRLAAVARAVAVQPQTRDQLAGHREIDRVVLDQQHAAGKRCR
jgi:hypothetical protein